MRTAVLLFGFIFCLNAFSVSRAQTHTPRYVAMSSKVKGYYEYLPEGYNATAAATYPLILFLSGIGEFGTGSTTQLPNVLEEGLPRNIDTGGFPKSFIVNGQTFRFIVITPQFLKGSNPDAADVNAVLDFIVANYKVDLNRIYITGLSYGGGLSFAYPGSSLANAARVAAIVPIASPYPDGGDATIYARGRMIAAGNVAVWATHNRGDRPPDSSANTIKYIEAINEAPAPNPLAKMTIFAAGGHNAWKRTYDPTFRENGLNVFEWMLQYQRNIVAPNQPPIANAGADQTITLPTNSVTLSGAGTDADGTIASYGWTKVSGPASGTITTPNAASTAITGLVQGTYVFRLTVSDNKGATATDDVTISVNAAANQTPTANAGTDVTITLPESSVTLKGSGSDADGTIASYQWTKVSGPAGGDIANAAAATTSISNLQEGIYVFRLKVTDNDGATASDDITILVKPAPNKAPTANAGADQVITLPINSVTLSGSGTDADGTISTYAWSLVSGPTGATITIPNAAATTVTGMVEGTYEFRLTVTDNDGAAASDNVVINVKPAPNKAPAANAGTDVTITLPVNTTTLSGSGTDSDGTIAAYTWTKVTGPTGGDITTPTNAQTTVTNLVQGAYVFRLTVTDNKGEKATDDVTVTVNRAPNQAPSANAGTDITITLPDNSITLTGSGTDADGSIASYTWTKVSGPGNGTIVTPAAATTQVTNLQEGSYVFRLTVKDNEGAMASDDVAITVNAAPNAAPQADAGSDQTITLPVNTVTLSGTATDSDGTIVLYKWVKVSGPDAGTLATPNANSTDATNLVVGLYTFRLTVTDNDGATATDEVQVTVNAAANKTPKANAGADQEITLPESQVSLSGSGTDVDGTIASYAWTLMSGPAGATITTPNAAATTVTGMVEGTYEFRLTVTDNDGASASDNVIITVKPAPNKAPIANAGADQTITLPTNSVTLSGAGTDADGTIASYAWTKVSGPAGGTISAPNAASTTITGLVQGTYVFRLTVSDNKGATASDDVTITVNAAANQAPTANAGADQNITLPVSTATLSSTGSDADGTIASYEWTKVAGPAGGDITAPANAQTTVTNLVQGAYTFRLTVTDNKGATASDDVVVTVLPEPANVPPVANAGPDTVITLPTSSLTLTGAGTDSDGTNVSYKWTKVSGPAGGDLATPEDTATVVSALQQGVYVFRLTVTDNKGATASDDVTVEVQVVTAIDDVPGVTVAVLVRPNPSTTNFSITLRSTSSKPVALYVTDAVGRRLETRSNLRANQTFTLGQQYRPGIYYAQLVQAGKKVTVRLLKR